MSTKHPVAFVFLEDSSWAYLFRVQVGFVQNLASLSSESSIDDYEMTNIKDSMTIQVEKRNPFSSRQMISDIEVELNKIKPLYSFDFFIVLRTPSKPHLRTRWEIFYDKFEMKVARVI
jgi:hypothetical protein